MSASLRPNGRAQALRQGEKYLRLGLLSRAITEYARLVETDPQDWAVVGALGDLFVRAGETDRAIEQYGRIGDALHERGVLPKAAAVYQRILRLKPDIEPVQIKSADIWLAQGMPAEAKRMLRAVADGRTRAGNRGGAVEMLQRIADLDPEDLDAGLAAAMAAGENGETSAAVDRLASISRQFRERGDTAESVRALEAASGLDKGNAAITGALVALCIETGDLDLAAAHASNSGDFKAVAAAMSAGNRGADALAALGRALECDPSDREARLRLAREATAGGNLDLARACLAGDLDDLDLLFCLAEVEMLSGDAAAAHRVAERAVGKAPTRLSDMIALGIGLAERAPDAAFEWIDVAVDRALSDGDGRVAGGALVDFTSRVRLHVPALMKLVEISVDYELHDTLRDAQIQLADAYLHSGHPGEARVIAEDLVAQEPTNAAHVARLRRVLEMLGEPDPDECIAERLNTESLNALFREPGVRDAAPPAPPAPVAAPPGPREEPAAPDGPKTKAGRQAAGTEHYQRALDLCEAGRVDEAIAALKQSVRSPRHRFESVTLLAKLYRDRDELHDAIEWYERAIHAAPGPEATHDVLYELGTALVAAGEGDRALAVFLELRTEAPGYKDVSRQVQRLSRRAAGSGK